MDDKFNDKTSVGGSSNKNRLSSNDQRIEALRASLGVDDDYPKDVLEAVLAATDNETSSCSIEKHETLQLSDSAVKRVGRIWENCHPAPSRPGAVRVGGLLQSTSSERYNIGHIDQEELDLRRVVAIHEVQENLNQRLGYDLRASGQYEEMEILYIEGERMLSSTILKRRKEKFKPNLVVWDAQAVLEEKMNRMEPMQPILSKEPLSLPMSLLGVIDDNDGGSNEICVGKIVHSGHVRSDDDCKMEEETLSSGNNSSIVKSADTSADDSSRIEPYELTVTCSNEKCRADSSVGMNVGLVICPHCRNIFPATRTTS